MRLVSSLGTGRSDGDSVAAEMERSHVLGGECGPLKPTSQSGGGCWEPAVLGNDLAGGLRDDERGENKNTKKGADKGE